MRYRIVAFACFLVLGLGGWSCESSDDGTDDGPSADPGAATDPGTGSDVPTATDPGTTQDPGNGSGGGESRLYMFDVSGEKHLWSVRIDGTDLVDHGYIAGAKSAPYAFYLSPDGGHALFKDDGIQHLDLKTGQLTAFSAMPGIIGVFSPDSTRVLSLGWGVKTYGLDGSVVATLDGFDLDTVEQILGAWSADGSKVVIAGEFKVEGQTTGAVILADGNLGNASVVYTEQYLNPLNVQFLPDGRILITRFAGITLLDAAGAFVASTDWPGERETKCGPFYNTRLFCPRPDAAGTGLYVLFHDSNGQHLHHMSLDLATDEVLTEGMVLVQKEDLHFNPGRTAVFIGDAHKDHGHRVMDLPGGATHTGFLDAELGRKVIGFQ